MGFEDYLFPGLLPGISDSLHTNVVAVAQGCTIFGLAYIMSVPLCAYMLSKRPVRHVLVTALGLFMIGNMITLFSPNLMVYIASRFVSGLGGGLFLPVAMAAGTQLVEPGFRGRALSVLWSSNCAGAVIGVPLGLWLADRMGWRATVILILIIAALALVGLMSRPQVVLAAAPPPSLREQFRLLLNRQVLAVIGVTFFTATGCLGLYSYITQVLSGTVISSEVAFSLWSVGGLVGSMGIGYVLDRIGKPKLVMAVILAVLFLAVTSIPVLRWVPIWGFLPFLLWGAMGWSTVSTQQYNLMKINSNHEAILVALNSSAVSLGSVVGTALGGLALASGFGTQNLPYATAGLLLCAFIGQLLVMKQRR